MENYSFTASWHDKQNNTRPVTIEEVLKNEFETDYYRCYLDSGDRINISLDDNACWVEIDQGPNYLSRTFGELIENHFM